MAYEAFHTVMAAVGEQACLNCQLIQTKEVHQVTWQKILPDGERTIATDNLHFGQRMDPYFSGKVEFRDAGLQNSSILIREVTEEDEGYYRCMLMIISGLQNSSILIRNVTEEDEGCYRCMFHTT
uniref:Ig-like domain-containing protein n=1 Tax=Labrus bergylta TaxID=56723 RepID=A0A3Q3ED74_9LABR